MSEQQKQTPRTIKYLGKDYVTVAERVRLAHEDGGGFTVTDWQVWQLGDTGRWFYTATVEVQGQRHVGTSEIKLDAKGSTADAKAPVECAETSAVGRALGFAGFGAVESIASAEEMQRATSTQAQPQRRVPAPNVAVSVLAEMERPNSTKQWNPLQDVEFRRRLSALGTRTVADVAAWLETHTAADDTREIVYEQLKAIETGRLDALPAQHARS